MKKTLTVVTGGHGGMGKAICKELGKTSVIVLAGRNLTKESAKAELDELGIKSYLCKTDIADDAQVQALAEFAASLGDVKQVIHTSGVSPSDTTTENIIRINAIGTVNMVKFILSDSVRKWCVDQFLLRCRLHYATNKRMDTGI